MKRATQGSDEHHESGQQPANDFDFLEHVSNLWNKAAAAEVAMFRSVPIAGLQQQGRQSGLSRHRKIIPHSFCPLKFAVQLNRLAVWHNESEIYDVPVRVNHREHHAFQQSALRAAGDIEEVKLYAFSIGRHFPLHV